MSRHLWCPVVMGALLILWINSGDSRTTQQMSSGKQKERAASNEPRVRGGDARKKSLPSRPSGHKAGVVPSPVNPVIQSPAAVSEMTARAPAASLRLEEVLARYPLLERHVHRATQFEESLAAEAGASSRNITVMFPGKAPEIRTLDASGRLLESVDTMEKAYSDWRSVLIVRGSSMPGAARHVIVCDLWSYFAESDVQQNPALSDGDLIYIFDIHRTRDARLQDWGFLSSFIQGTADRSTLPYLLGR